MLKQAEKGCESSGKDRIMLKKNILKESALRNQQAESAGMNQHERTSRQEPADKNQQAGISMKESAGRNQQARISRQEPAKRN
jgi:hypothetical protein